MRGRSLRRRRFTSPLLAVVLMALVAAGCAGDDGAETPILPTSTVDVPVATDATTTTTPDATTTTADTTTTTTTSTTTTSTTTTSITTIGATTTTIDVGVDTLAQAWPWHRPGSAHATPDAAAAEFAELLGFPGDAVLGEFVSGVSAIGSIVIDVGPLDHDLATKVFVRPDASGDWEVVGATSTAIVVDLPPPGADVTPPLDVHFVHNADSSGVRVELWLDGESEPILDQLLTVGASGAFTAGTWDATIEWPSEIDSSAIAVFRSGSADETLAVTTVSLRLGEADSPAVPPIPPTMLGPIGDQRDDILYQPGVRLSIREPTECSDGGRPTIVTGGPSSDVFVDWFRERGYLVANVAWRSPGYTGGLSPGTLKAFTYAANDLGVAVQWLRAHAGELCVDPDRIAAVGYSFGAITSLSLAYSAGEFEPGDIISVDELGDPAEMTASTPTPPPELDPYSNRIGAVVSFAGFALAGTIEAGEPPALLIHGRDDGGIPFTLAEQTCAAAAEVGVTCELLAHDSGHGLADDVPAALEAADEFLRTELQNATATSP